MKALTILLSACSFIWSSSITAQTTVSGGIYNNTTWSKAASPYVVTGDVVVFPGKLLTIEPGVTVRFAGNYKLEVRGGISAIGTAADSISFRSDTGFVKGSWDKIHILSSTQNAYGFFEYCHIRDAWSGIMVECCWGNDDTYVENSMFVNNVAGIDEYGGWILPVTNCIFIRNMFGSRTADKAFNNCQFRYNDTGLDLDRSAVYNCTFEYNNVGFNFTNGYTSSTVQACSISNNTVGVRVRGGTIMNNTITANGTGMILGHYTQGPYYQVPIANNKVCHNTFYNIRNMDAYNMSLGNNNCFCETDSATIEGSLYDGYDDITVGLFNYSIYDSTCTTELFTYYKIGSAPTTVSLGEPSLTGFRVYPSPFSDALKFASNNGQPFTLTVYAATGVLVYAGESDNAVLHVNTSGWAMGVYVTEIRTQSNEVYRRKIVK